MDWQFHHLEFAVRCHRRIPICISFPTLCLTHSGDSPEPCRCEKIAPQCKLEKSKDYKKDVTCHRKLTSIFQSWNTKFYEVLM